MASSSNQTNTEPKSGWRCRSCEAVNQNDRFYCQTCYVSQDGKTKLLEEARQRAVSPIETLRKWRCQSCEGVNPNDRYFCQTCYVSQDGKTNLSEDARQRAVDTIETLTKQPAAPTAAQPSEPTGPVHTSTLPTGPVGLSRTLLAQPFDPPPLQATGQPVKLVIRPLPPPSGPVWTSTLPTGPIDLNKTLLAQRFDPPPPFNEPPEATRRRVEYDVRAVTTWNRTRQPAARTAAQPTGHLDSSHTSTLPTGPIDPLPLRATGPLPLPVTQPLMRNPNKPATQSTAHGSTTDEAGFVGSAEEEQATKGCDKKDD